MQHAGMRAGVARVRGPLGGHIISQARAANARLHSSGLCSRSWRTHPSPPRSCWWYLHNWNGNDERRLSYG